jgi:hypothetical protein
MLDIEPYLVELIKKLAEIRTPIITTQGLELANSLISGTSIIDEVVAWKRDNCAAFQKNGTIKLGKRFWAANIRRNRHLIRSKEEVKFDNECTQWCPYLNMEEMYIEIYEDLCSTGLACEHPESLWRNKEGTLSAMWRKHLG